MSLNGRSRHQQRRPAPSHSLPIIKKPSLERRPSTSHVAVSPFSAIDELKVLDRKPLEEIHVNGQLGSSFRFEQRSRGAERLSEARIVNCELVSADGGQKPGVPEAGIYFLKCPDARLEPAKQEDFVNREFDNGSAINHVAARLSGAPFTVAKMIGRGKLLNPSANDDARPCLIYQYAGDPAETNCTLAREWRESYSGNALGFLKFADSFARAVQVLHNQGIVHSFIVPRNIVWRRENAGAMISSLRGEFTLVGFGYARMTDAAGRHADKIAEREMLGLVADDNWFRAPECRAEHSHAAFGYPADIYSIGAILYSTLLPNTSVGLDVLKQPPTDARLLKRRVAESLKAERGAGTGRPDLLQENENILKIIDSCLRYDADSRYSCVEELIEAIHLATNADPTHRKRSERASTNRIVRRTVSSAGFTEEVAALMVSDVATKSPDDLAPYFGDLRTSLAEDLGQRVGGLGRGHFEVYGHRDRIVMSLCRLLGSAHKDDIYRTMTLPDYWTDANLGSLGRFLTMNKHMARQGLRIERLFLVSDDFHRLSEEQQVVLENQLQAFEDLERQGFGQYMLIKVLKGTEERIADYERNGELVAYLQTKRAGTGAGARRSEDAICLNFFSTAKETWANGRVIVRRTIKKARYWNPIKVQRTEQFEKSVQQFEHYLETAELLKDFVCPEGQPKASEVGPLGQLIGTTGAGSVPSTR